MILSVYRKNSFRDWWALPSTCVPAWVKLPSSRHPCISFPLPSFLPARCDSTVLSCFPVLDWSGSFCDCWSENFPLCDMYIECYEFASIPTLSALHKLILFPSVFSSSICFSSLEIFFFDPRIIQKGVVQVSNVPDVLLFSFGYSFLVWLHCGPRAPCVISILLKAAERNVTTEDVFYPGVLPILLWALEKWACSAFVGQSVL